MTKTNDVARSLRLVGVAALALAAAGCGRDDSANVMAPGGNSLTPAQVDAALGPENADTGANALAGNESLNALNDMNEAGAINVQDIAPENANNASAEQ